MFVWETRQNESVDDYVVPALTLSHSLFVAISTTVSMRLLVQIWWQATPTLLSSPCMMTGEKSSLRISSRSLLAVSFRLTGAFVCVWTCMFCLGRWECAKDVCLCVRYVPSAPRLTPWSCSV